MRAITTAEEFKALGSAYTIIGAGGQIDEWTNGYADLLNEGHILNGAELKWVTWTGKEINEAFLLQGTNRFQDDVTFIAFELDDKMNMGHLAMFKLRMRDRWLDDIIDNATRSDEWRG